MPFAYTFMKGRAGGSFTVEHPLHFPADAPVKAGARHTLRPQPVVSRAGPGIHADGVQGRAHRRPATGIASLSDASRWAEEALWMMPFITTGEGTYRVGIESRREFAERVEPRR